MEEKELKYLSTSLKYKEAKIPNRTDNYGRPLVMRVAKQGDAEQETNEETGAKKWTCGAFFDMHINAYIKDEEYEELDEDKMIALAKKYKL